MGIQSHNFQIRNRLVIILSHPKYLILPCWSIYMISGLDSTLELYTKVIYKSMQRYSIDAHVDVMSKLKVLQ